ncbi:helix-turn-helix transcriptional regulator [Burkholderia ambifaria]|uniref:helix-turn-helix transcriptional regulator n=1 Tax=Burkholderia ambifaria TaxID=152480 RepID=UPI001B9D54E9|nr:AlpA family phage regulatory protein [Burkholderia ambifaria]MBR8256677.1 AlpA family phage regulatory protein [Burkholderia ambifaria]
MSDHLSDTYLRPAAAAKKLGIGVSTLWLRIKHDPTFPRAIKLSARTTVLSERELDAYVEKCASKPRG